MQEIREKIIARLVEVLLPEQLNQVDAVVEEVIMSDITCNLTEHGNRSRKN